MGGAYGHLMHLHEDLDLTFADLNRVFKLAGEGRLDGATEKTDGMNLVFTFDAATGRLLVARSAGDIKKGGLDAAALAGRFMGRPGDVVAAFQEGFETLRLALGALPERVARDVFGDTGTVWYSAEVIDPSCPNVIRYDERCIVLHAHGSFRLAEGKVHGEPAAPGIKALQAHQEAMATALVPMGRRLHMPQPFNGKLRRGPVVRAQQAVSELLTNAGLNKSSSFRDLIARRVQQSDHLRGLPRDVADAVIARMVGRPGAMTLTQVRKLAGPDARDRVDGFVAWEKEMAASVMRSVEMIVYRFSVELLRGMRSAMVSDHKAEVSRLREAVRVALPSLDGAIHGRHLDKLHDLNDIDSSAEGIVFRLGDRAYKMTGAFAPANQVLGVSRYGRTQPD